MIDDDADEVGRAVQAALDKDGMYVHDKSVERDESQRILGLIARPITVFQDKGLWRPITTRLDREPNRSEGVGESPLHMDFVNAENPPDIVVLYCERPDPRGGGWTVLADNRAAAGLQVQDAEVLGQREFRDGKVVNLVNIGEDINPFPVLAHEGRWRFRYTANLIARAESGSEQYRALANLGLLLAESATTLLLKSGHFVIIDQHRMVHGKTPLGEDQAEVEEGSRRLLWQTFGRVDSDPGC